VFQILADFYGTDNMHFTLHSPEFNGVTQDDTGVTRPELTRSYTSFTQAIWDNAESRVYLGDHWQFDANAAVTMGVQVGNYDFNNLLQPIKRNHKELAGLPNIDIVALTAVRGGLTVPNFEAGRKSVLDASGTSATEMKYLSSETAGRRDAAAVPVGRSAAILRHASGVDILASTLDGRAVQDLLFAIFADGAPIN
jgi:hypothetical protein